jgi:Ferritin-like domain
MVSRRQLLSGASAAGAGVVLAGCGSSQLASGIDPGVLQSEVATLNRLIAVEYDAVAAYVAAIPLLTGTDALYAKQFLSQDLSHIEDLAAFVRKTGNKPVASNQIYQLGHPKSRAQLLAVLHHVEQVTLRAYLRAIPTLTPGAVKATAASIFANDAQHAGLLRGRLGLAPVPEAVVTGTA